MRAPVKLTGLNFVEMFVWLSRSTQQVARSKPDEQVALQPPGWAPYERGESVARCRGFTARVQPRQNRSALPGCPFIRAFAGRHAPAGGRGWRGDRQQLAEVGTELSVKTALDSICTCLAINTPEDATEEVWHALLLDAMRAALEAVPREATTRDTPLRDLACTLSVAVARPAMVVAAQVGDGAVVGADGDGKSLRHHATDCRRIPHCAPPQSDETTFLISPGALDQIQFAHHSGNISRLALLTDGLQTLALKVADGEPHVFSITGLRMVAKIYHRLRQEHRDKLTVIRLKPGLDSLRLRTNQRTLWMNQSRRWLNQSVRSSDQCSQS